MISFPEAAVVQLGSAEVGGTGVDTDGQSRINIELDASNFAAGTYNVLQFRLDAEGDGDVTPLLFQRNGSNNGYTVL